MNSIIMRKIVAGSILVLFFASCSLQKKIARSAQTTILSNTALSTAHVGISIFEPATGKRWYDFQGDKYFIPASNTKIPTCYAAMKYLGDSLPGLKYAISVADNFQDTVLAFQPTGDPTFLHPDFKTQPVLDFLRNSAERPNYQLGFFDAAWKDDHWGSGWAWTDYDAAYMAERSSFPIYGNVIDIRVNELENRNIRDTLFPGKIKLFKTQTPTFDSLVNQYTYSIERRHAVAKQPQVRIERNLHGNSFSIISSNGAFAPTSIPFITQGSNMAQGILYNDLGIRFGLLYKDRRDVGSAYRFLYPGYNVRTTQIDRWYNVYSQPTDSMLRLMMHRSDNFFAEQSLLMVSNELIGEMNDAKLVDTLLKTDFKDLPQRPRWADGSGLSRYNLFTPQDIIAILHKMKNEFGMERIKVIFPTGGEGTISSYYKMESGYIYAKTGTLSGVVALSGYLVTKKNKELIFSVLVNNHQASATDVRRAVEKFLQSVRNNY